MEKKIESPSNVVETDDIKAVLDEALKFNLNQKAQGKNEFQNILLVGETGSAKTAIVEKWLEENKVNSWHIFPDVDKMIYSDDYAKLNRPNSILVLDMFDRTPKEIRTNFLEFIKTHTAPDLKSPGKRQKIDNFLFAIATANPSTHAYHTFKFDDEELKCFKQVQVVMNPQKLLEYLTKQYEKELEEAQKDGDKEEISMIKGRLALAKAILTNKNFKFDNDSNEIDENEIKEMGALVTYGTVSRALLWSDGTKQNFLEGLPHCVRKGALPMFEEILRDYKD